MLMTKSHLTATLAEIQVAKMAKISCRYTLSAQLSFLVVDVKARAPGSSHPGVMGSPTFLFPLVLIL